jgi:hypothetical protein
LTKLLKLGETRNLLGFEHKLLLLYCVLFCQENELQAKTLILLENAPGQTANLAEVRTPLDVKVV